MSIEAMRYALAALEWNLPVIEDYGHKEQLNRQRKAITAIKQALAAPTVQEPVAWIWKYANGEEEVVFVPPRHVDASHVDAPSTITPLYTTPPAAQRPFVGLTDEELREFDVDPVEAKLMIAKLKGKNT